MRNTFLLCLFFCSSFLRPATAWAQMGFSKGSCVLLNGQELKGSFQLRLATVQSPAILVYYDGKQEQQFEPTQVRRCTLGRHSYVVDGNFVAPDDKGGVPVDHDFVEVLDTTGRVQLFRYDYEGYLGSYPGGYVLPAVAALGTGLASGGTAMVIPLGGRPSYQKTYLLLLRAGSGKPMVPYAPGPRKGLFSTEQEKLIMPAVGATTDLFPEDEALRKRIEAGKLSPDQLPAAVRAYNQGVRLPVKN